MAQTLSATLEQNERAYEEDDDALRSQLMASMEQNKMNHASNGISLLSAAAAMQELGDSTRIPERKKPSTSTELSNDMAEQHDAENGDSPESSSEEEGEEEEGEEDVEMAEAQPETTETKQLDATSLHGDEASETEEQDTNDIDDEATAETEVFEDAASTADSEEAQSEDDSIGAEAAEETEELAEADVESAAEESGDSSSEDSDNEADACLFCDQKELEQPDSKPDLHCSVCRRPAHYACATEKDAIEDEIDHWRCPDCTRNFNSESPKSRASKARQSAPRIVRDLLPVSKGVQKPGAHSIFAQPLIEDDEGGRSLRKRKSPSTEHNLAPRRYKKKIKATPQPEKVESLPDPEPEVEVEVEAEPKPELEPEAEPEPDPETMSLSTRQSSLKLVTSTPSLPPPTTVPTARILQHRPFHKPPPHKFILAFRLDQSKIEAIMNAPPRPARRKYKRQKQKIPPPPIFQPPVPKFPALPTHNVMFSSMFGDRENDINAKPYGGILSEADADTTRSLPQLRDRDMFENARKGAEEERRLASEKAEAQLQESVNGDGGNTANSKRQVAGPPSKIKCIQFGKHVIDTSYAAPYPEEYSHESRLFICEFCLKYLPSAYVAWRHKLKCPAKHPPGDEIYRDGTISVWEVDGRKKTEYCQCLCLMAKLFLGSKTLYYDVDPFLFYVLTEYDEHGYHFVGYFSKEKRPASQNNVSCILVMPIHQRKGYATFLIEFSYLLTRIEGKEGSPEKPLSDMGLTAYRSYWDLTLSRHLLDLGDKPFGVKDIMYRTGMTADDVVHSLERLYALVKDPVTKTYAIRYNQILYETIVEKYESKNFRKIEPQYLIWTPYIMGRSDAAILDAQPITAVAQREDDDMELDIPEGTGSPPISPKAVQEALQPEQEKVDPALINDIGRIAPGPPEIDVMEETDAMEVDNDDAEEEEAGQHVEEEDIEDQPVLDKGKARADSPLTGYALTYELQKIPPTRFQIDPPIPPAMIRAAKSKRKSTTGTPRPKVARSDVGSSSKPLRSSPRKAGSTNGSTTGIGSSRATTPDRQNPNPRRSVRKSGLANEITTNGTESEDQQAEGNVEDHEQDDPDDDVDEEVEEDQDDGDSGGEESEDDQLDDTNAVGAAQESMEEDVSDAESRSDESEASENSQAVIEESDASDDPDAVVEDEDDDDGSDEEEEPGLAATSARSSVSGSVEASEDESEDE